MLKNGKKRSDLYVRNFPSRKCRSKNIKKPMMNRNKKYRKKIRKRIIKENRI